MKLFKELAITLLFLALYTPLSLALWYKTGKAINLIFVFIIGLGLATIYVYTELARYYVKRMFRKRKTYIQLSEESEEEIEPEPEEQDYDLENFEGFRSLFSQDKPGGEAI